MSYHENNIILCSDLVYYFMSTYSSNHYFWGVLYGHALYTHAALNAEHHVVPALMGAYSLDISK